MTVPILLAAWVIALQGADVGHDPTWMTCRWTADDSRFISIRKELEPLVGDKPKLDTIVTSAYKKCLGQRVLDTDLYRWSLATILRARNDYDYAERLLNSYEMQKPYHLYPSLSRPESYEYTRIRYFMAVAYDFPHENMIPMGRKILARSPKDLSAMLTLLTLYQPQVSQEQSREGARLVAQLDSLAGNEVRVLVTTGNYYGRAWIAKNDAANAKEAIRRLQRAIEFSSNVKQKEALRAYIKYIESRTK